MRFLTALCLLTLGLSNAAGQELALDERLPPDAVKNRFDLGDQITAVTRGRVQLEGGYTFVHDRITGTNVDQHILPDMLLRIGLTERLELRLGWPGYVSTHYDDALGAYSTSETLNPSIGFMLDLFPQDGWRPQTAIQAAVPISLDGNPLTMASTQPLTEVLYCWYPRDRWTVGGSTGVGLIELAGDHFAQLEQTLNVDYLLTDRIGTFMEWSVVIDQGSAEDGSQHLLSLGTSFLWTEALQVSWRAGLGLNERAPDFLTGIRFALRF
ncbi:MAG: transporter [Thermoguttaceae bacterium]